MFSTLIHYTINPLLLRLGLAAVFIYHGLTLVGGSEHDWGAHWNPGPDAPPGIVQLLVAWGELIGGVAIGAGFLTRLAALGIIAIMAGAIATVHWPNGFDITKGGFEYNVVLIIMCVCLVLGGPGPLAVDRYFRIKRERKD
jgi:putative oxidoreductase